MGTDKVYADEGETSRVEVVSVVDNEVVKRLAICRFDFYTCYRRLCCFSRFYHPFRCPRFVEVRKGAFSPKVCKSDSGFLKHKERC